MRLLANTDEQGNIINSLYGEFVVDLEDDYEIHLEITQEQANDLQNHKIINGNLVSAK